MDVVCDVLMEYLRQPSFIQAHFTLQELKKDEKLLLILNEALKVLQYINLILNTSVDTYVCLHTFICSAQKFHICINNCIENSIENVSICLFKMFLS